MKQEQNFTKYFFRGVKKRNGDREREIEREREREIDREIESHP